MLVLHYSRISLQWTSMETTNDVYCSLIYPLQWNPPRSEQPLYIAIYTLDLYNEPLKSGQPLYNGHTLCSHATCPLLQ